ncbi:MAG: L,D-transpeptidase [Puniceicoccales bacterium]|nr:L,D-transpeptidase [Puniceicoccales bacterium]
MEFSKIVTEVLRRSQQVTDPLVAVSIAEGALFFCDGRGVSKRYPASTSLCFPCCLQHSNGTPSGLHTVAEKYGDGLPIGEVLIGRRPTGKHFSFFANWRRGCHVVSRILRLRGLEDGINSGVNREGHCCDSHARYIYIHGTAREDLVGLPFTSGCISLLAKDLLELYEKTPVGTLVWIR